MWRALADQWLCLMVGVSLKGLVLLAIAVLLNLGLWKASAATRRLGWLLTLMALLLLPVLSLALPPWEVSVTEAAWPSRSMSSSGEEQPGFRPAVAGTITTNSSHSAASPTARTAAAPQVARDQVAPGSAASITPAPTVPRVLPLILLMAWLSGCTGFLLRMALSLRAIGALERSCLEWQDPRIAAMLSEAAARLGLRRRVKLLKSLRVGAIPMTWGQRRPVVLLPAEAESWPAERLKAVLLHELAHVRSADWAALMLSRFACAVYWFHPLAWTINRALSQESERACDDAVIASGVPGTAYASHLLELARSFRDARGGAVASIAIMQASQLRSRLRYLLAPGRNRHAPSRRTAIALLILGMVALIPIASVRQGEGPNGFETDSVSLPSSAPKWGRIAGRVVYDNGTPACGISVRAVMNPRHGERLPWSVAVFLSRLQKYAVTGADGRYEMDDLPAGPYEIIPPDEPGQWVDRGAHRVTVEANRTSTARDIRLTTGSTIRGRVVDSETGQPIAGLYIGCDGPRLIGKGMPLWYSMPITGKDGRFSLTAPAGRACLYPAGPTDTVNMNVKIKGFSFSHRPLDVIKVGSVLYADGELVQVTVDRRAPISRRMNDAGDPLVIVTRKGETHDLLLRFKRLKVLPGNSVIVGR